MNPALEEQQGTLEPARQHHETRLWIRELLSQNGPMTTGQVASVIRLPMKLTSRKLFDMEVATMVKVIAANIPGVTRRENVWALRCHPAPAIRQENDQAEVPR